MNILVIKPMSNKVYKDDTTMFCEGLSKLGHTVIELEATYNYDSDMISYDKEIPGEILKNVDIAWAPYEPLIPVILYFKELYPNIRTVGHFELIPPLKVNVENINESYIMNDTPEEDAYFKKYQEYKFYTDCWTQCDFKTYVSDSELVEMERLLGRRIDKRRIAIKPYPIDTEMLDSYRIDNAEQKRQILCSVRLVPHKKIHHIIRALSYLNNPPKLVLIGTGQAYNALKKFAMELNVDVEFKGLVSDCEKVKAIQESMFAVYPWAWLPVTEAAYFKKPSIVYYFPESDARLRDSAYYVENNNIEELSKAIEMFTNDEQTRIVAGEKAYNMLIRNELPTVKISRASEIMEHIFKEVLK